LFTDAEEVAYHFLPNETLCRSFVPTIGVSLLAFLFNLFLMLIDRIVAVVKTSWHRANVTTRFVVTSSILLNLLLTLGLNWVYITAPLHCAYHKSHVLTLRVTWIVLFISCVISISFVYSKTKATKQSNSSNDHSNNHPLNLEANNINNNEDDDDGPSSNNSEQDQQMTMMDPVEMESTRKFVISLIPLLFIPLPILVSSFSTSLCLHLRGKNAAVCSPFVTLATYDNKIFSFSALLSPLMTIWKDDQFHSSLLRLLTIPFY
jgi:hypothetical protein